MAYKFLTTERDQLFFLPPSLTDCLPEDHLAWFVLDALAQMDLEAFYADYRPDGWASLSGANLQPQSSGRPETAQAKSATHH